MKEWIVEVPALGSDLAADFKQGPFIDERGRRSLTEETVARFDGLKIQVFSNEHPPPHFRVIYSGDSANFSIKDCRKLNGGLQQWDRNIRKWHALHRQDLIDAWNRLRPGNCPVGEYKETE